MRKLLLFVFLLACCGQLFAQYAVTDSLFNIIRSAKYDSIKIDAVNSIPIGEYAPDSVLFYGQKVIEEGRKQKNDLLVALGWSQMSYGYSRSDNQPRALQAALTGLKVAEKYNNPVVLACIYSNIAISYLYSFPKRMEYSSKAISIINQSKPNGLYPVILFSMATYFLDNKQLDSALHYAERAYEMGLTFPDKHFSQNFISRILGKIHLLLHNNDLALSYYRMALYYSIASNTPRNLYLSYLGMGEYYGYLHKEDSALYYYRKSFEIAGKTKTTSYLVKPAQWLYSYYRQRHNIDSALQYHEIYTAAKDSINSTKKAVELQGISLDEDIRQQNILAENERATKERSHDIQLVILAIAILVAVIIFLLLSRSFIVSHKLIEFLGVIVLLIVFEFINLLLHPFLQSATNDSPALMLLALVAIAALIVPFHHRLEKWVNHKLVQKNKAIRLANAKKIIEELEEEKAV